MGCCASRCLPENDMTYELEAELEENHLSPISIDSTKNTTYLNNKRIISTNSSISSNMLLIIPGEVKCSECIGKGDCGTVYKGTYRGSTVAIKCIDLTSTEKGVIKKDIEHILTEEASKISMLRHPNAVLFMGAYIDKGRFCIISEYCTRGSLYDILHNKETRKSRISLNWNIRILLALGAARGLLYLHSADPPLVHEYIKSTNILIDDSWNSKLADFGTQNIAKVCRDPSLSISKQIETNNNLLRDVDMIRWTAPELLAGGKDCIPTTSSDVYSLGMVLWELTTMEIPYNEVHKAMDIKNMVLSDEKPLFNFKKMNKTWILLVENCLSMDIKKRPTTAEIVSTLEMLYRDTSLKGSYVQPGFITKPHLRETADSM